MKNLFFVILFFNSICLIAQKKDTLKSVLILENKSEKEIINKNLFNYHFQDSAGMIDVKSKILENTSVQLRTGGLNDFAALSIRGSSVSQTLVKWNGVPMNSSLSGIGDISLFFNAQFDNMVLYTQGSGFYAGNAAVAGILDVENKILDTSSKLNLYFGIGQFSRFSNKISWQQKIKNSYFVIKTTILDEKNNYPFPYKKDFSWYLNKNENGGLNAKGIQASYYFNKNKWQSSNHIWLTARERGISPLINSFDQKALLEENSLRFSSQNKLSIKGFNANITFGFNHEKLNYINEFYKLNQKNFSNYFYNQISFKLNQNNFLNLFHFVLENSYAYMNVNDTLKALYNGSIGVWVDKNISNKLNFNIAYKGVLFQNKFYHLPSFSLNYPIASKNILSLTINKVFRNPTLNDLYYIPGGNPLLLPEIGWGYTLNSKNIFSNKKFNKSIFNASIYYRNINNWILWYGTLIWSPRNVSLVKSYGTEFSFIKDFEINNKSKIVLSASYTFARSTTEKVSSVLFQNSLHKSISYIPAHILSILGKAHFYNFDFELNSQYQSKKFATMDESIAINSFIIFGSTIGYNIQIKNKMKINTQMKVNNIFNAYYENILNRPMPGRWVEMSILVQRW